MKKQNAWVKNLLFVCKNFNGKAFFAVCIDMQTAVTQKNSPARCGAVVEWRVTRIAWCVTRVTV